ncbi:MAG: DUF2917 domain-containing protein [Pseudomonadota bacterium]
MKMLALEHNRPVWISGATRIECVAGRVWLTRTHGAGDVFIYAGDSYMLARSEYALAEALGQARITLHAAPTTGWRLFALVAGVLSSWHERMRTLRFDRRRTPLAG